MLYSSCGVWTLGGRLAKSELYFKKNKGQDGKPTGGQEIRTNFRYKPTNSWPLSRLKVKESMTDTFMKQQRMNHERLSSATNGSFVSLEYNNDIRYAFWKAFLAWKWTVKYLRNKWQNSLRNKMGSPRGYGLYGPLLFLPLCHLESPVHDFSQLCWNFIIPTGVNKALQTRGTSRD